MQIFTGKFPIYSIINNEPEFYHCTHDFKRSNILLTVNIRFESTKNSQCDILYSETYGRKGTKEMSAFLVLQFQSSRKSFWRKYKTKRWGSLQRRALNRN